MSTASMLVPQDTGQVSVGCLGSHVCVYIIYIYIYIYTYIYISIYIYIYISTVSLRLLARAEPGTGRLAVAPH